MHRNLKSWFTKQSCLTIRLKNEKRKDREKGIKEVLLPFMSQKNVDLKQFFESNIKTLPYKFQMFMFVRFLFNFQNLVTISIWCYDLYVGSKSQLV